MKANRNVWLNSYIIRKISIESKVEGLVSDDNGDEAYGKIDDDSDKEFETVTVVSTFP